MASEQERKLSMTDSLTRREIFRLGAAGLVAGALADAAAGAEEQPPGLSAPRPARPFLTPGKRFRDVSRGKPIPHTLAGDDLVKARLTPETWRLEIVAHDRPDTKNKATVEKPLTVAAGSALDLPALRALSERLGVRFLKAMQCQNIAFPLGQGLWEGVPLRDVLALCGSFANVRRVYYWGYHNDKPEQIFQSSLALNQVLDTPPGELPPFVAYQLNGGPIPLERGGPVRMVVPWAHGFKSVKWLQRILLTNDFQANDTYAVFGNDPESYLKTAAYFDDLQAGTFAAGEPVVIRGTAMVGWPGLERVEIWLRPDTGARGKLADDDPAWARAAWRPAAIDPPPPDWGGGLRDGVLPKAIWGFDGSGKPKEWPLPFSIAHWTIVLKNLAPGDYEVRARTVDKNGFAQPAPRPGGLTGKNQVQCKLFTVRKDA